MWATTTSNSSYQQTKTLSSPLTALCLDLTQFLIIFWLTSLAVKGRRKGYFKQRHCLRDAYTHSQSYSQLQRWDWKKNLLELEVREEPLRKEYKLSARRYLFSRRFRDRACGVLCLGPTKWVFKCVFLKPHLNLSCRQLMGVSAWSNRPLSSHSGTCNNIQLCRPVSGDNAARWSSHKWWDQILRSWPS